MTGIILAAVVVAVVGIIIGFFLGFSSEKFKVEVDPKEEAVLGVLPGNNCGGCGFPGCSGLAAAIAKGEAGVGDCPVGGEPIANKIAEIMGVEAGTSAKEVAFVHCDGNCDKAKEKFEYHGVEDCNAAMFAPGAGSKACKYGCLGLGSCMKACPFDAIEIVDGIAVVNKEICKACKKCIAACPKHLIDLVPYEEKKVKVHCINKDKGKEVMGVCSTGCIGCSICEKTCKFDAIHVVDNVAVIDYEKCIGCKACARKCPKKIIY